MPGLYKILDDAVANPLARISGVGSVSISGAPKREIHIYVDPERLEAYSLSVEQIASVVGAENRNIPSGSIDIGSDTYSVRVQGEFLDSREMASLVVASRPDGRKVLLSEVARIDDSLEERAQQTYNNGQRGAMIVIQKQSGANSVEISDQVLKMLPQLQKRLPADIEPDVLVDTSDNIRNTIASLVETVLYALFRGDSGVYVSRPLARDAHHHHYYTHIAHSFVYISCRDGQFYQHYIAVGSVDPR